MQPSVLMRATLRGLHAHSTVLINYLLALGSSLPVREYLKESTHQGAHCVLDPSTDTNFERIPERWKCVKPHKQYTRIRAKHTLHLQVAFLVSLPGNFQVKPQLGRTLQRLASSKKCPSA